MSEPTEEVEVITIPYVDCPFKMTNGELWEIATEEYKGDHPDHPGAEFVEQQMWDEGRWSIWWRVVLRHDPTDSWWAGEYETAATEMQEVDEERKVKFYRVFPRVVAKTVYER